MSYLDEEYERSDISDTISDEGIIQPKIKVEHAIGLTPKSPKSNVSEHESETSSL